MVALPLAGSAILLISCDNKASNNEQESETMMTQQSDSLVIIESQNGKLINRFSTPLLESYELAKEPYREFRKGVKVETYNDSTGMLESTLEADYAIFLENQKLWEAKGNVVATNARGHILETQQLFWNQKTKKIYSNVDSKVTQGTDVIVGVGFESDETFNDWMFRRPKGKVLFNVEPTNPDSVAQQTSVQPPTEEIEHAKPSARPELKLKKAKKADESTMKKPRPATELR